MAVRPLAFGARFVEKGRTVRILPDPADPRRYAVKVSRPGGASRTSQHRTAAEALREFATAWRARLH